MSFIAKKVQEYEDGSYRLVRDNEDGTGLFIYKGESVILKRCKKGYWKDPKTGECVPKEQLQGTEQPKADEPKDESQSKPKMRWDNEKHMMVRDGESDKPKEEKPIEESPEEPKEEPSKEDKPVDESEDKEPKTEDDIKQPAQDYSKVVSDNGLTEWPKVKGQSRAIVSKVIPDSLKNQITSYKRYKVGDYSNKVKFVLVGMDKLSARDYNELKRSIKNNLKSNDNYEIHVKDDGFEIWDLTEPCSDWSNKRKADYLRELQEKNKGYRNSEDLDEVIKQLEDLDKEPSEELLKRFGSKAEVRKWQRKMIQAFTRAFYYSVGPKNPTYYNRSDEQKALEDMGIFKPDKDKRWRDAEESAKRFGYYHRK